MKTTSRLSSLFLLIALLAQLSGCSGSAVNDPVTTEPNGSESTEPLETVDPSKVLDLPDTDWGGREFRVLGYTGDRPQWSTFEIYAESENGEVVNDAIFRRNTMIEEKYNVKIVQILDPSEGDVTSTNVPVVQKAAISGDDLFDLAFFNLAGIGKAARNGYLYNLLDVDYIDFSKDWWNPDVNEMLTFADKLYFTTSDFSLRDKSRAYIGVYNRDMVNDFKLGDAVQLVRDGKWTIDVLTEWAKAVSNDLNGNGEVDVDDRFGVCCDNYDALGTFVTAMDNVIIKKNSEGLPELSINNERTISSIDKVLALTSPEDVTIFPPEWQGKVDYDYWSVASRVFKSGHSLFITAFPHGLKTYSAECEFDYGIIPYPKYDETQDKYYTVANIYCMLFGIPVSCQDPDFAGFMLEALSAASTDTTLEAYYEISCKTKYTYDEDSAEMLDLIFDGIIYDPAYAYGISGMNTIFKNVAKKRENTFASDYASIEKSALSDIDKLIADLEREN